MNPASKKGRRLGESEVLLAGFLFDRIAMEALRETIGSRPKEVIGSYQADPRLRRDIFGP
jgi:hypothetical protein